MIHSRVISGFGLNCCLLVALSTFASGGCSSLEVKVSVYSGPMVDPPRARLAWAVGVARSIRDIAADAVEGPLACLVRCPVPQEEDCPPSGNVTSQSESVRQSDINSTKKPRKLHKVAADLRGLMESVACLYCELEIDQTYSACLASPGNDTPDCHKTVANLIVFGNHAQTMAQRIGHLELVKNFYLEILLPMPRTNDELVAVLVTIDETGRIATNLAQSVASEWELERRIQDSGNVGKGSIYQQRIQHVMNSQKPGALLTSIKNSPVWYGCFVKRHVEQIYEERFWKEINPLRTAAVGESFTVLVKDETGNWQIKAVSVDPSKVTEAASKTGLAVAKALLAS